MNDALTRYPSKLECLAVRAYSAIALLGTTALGGVGGYLAGKALAPEGHTVPVLDVGVETIVGVGSGVVGACTGVLAGAITLIAAHSA